MFSPNISGIPYYNLMLNFYTLPLLIVVYEDPWRDHQQLSLICQARFFSYGFLLYQTRQRHHDKLNPNQMGLLQTGRLISASKQDSLAATVNEKKKVISLFSLIQYGHYIIWKLKHKKRKLIIASLNVL
jgi:hypothetical protein